MAQNNPFIVISNINVKLTVKEKNDGGSAVIAASSSGTFVPFNKYFIDVRSITVSAEKQANPVGTNAIAIYEFGTEADGGFIAYVIHRLTGDYIGGRISWTARGV